MYVEWPQKLGDKNLTEYCKKYLKAIIPKRSVYDMFGGSEPGRILYFHRSGVVAHNIGTIRCEVPYHDLSRTGKSYHITEAPEKDCVYTLTRIKKGRSPFKIVFKVCGFESNDVPNSIYSYNNFKAWPPNAARTHLTSFCANYLQAVIPNRMSQEGLYGESDVFILQYTQIDWRMLKVGIVKCCDPPSGRRRPSYYYITESPEPDCVFTLLRTSKFRICSIVYQFCGIRIGKYVEEGSETNRDSSLVNRANKLESKPDLNTNESAVTNKSSVDDTDEMEIKPDTRTSSFLPDD